MSTWPSPLDTMEIRNRETGAVIHLSQFKADHPRTAFPKKINTLVLDSYGYDPILEGPQADVTGPYEISVRDGIEEVNGQWFTKYVVGPSFADEEERSAWVAQIDDDAAKAVRQDRDERLSKTDWAVLADSPLTTAKKTAWKTYRQALRDITTSEGFPHNVAWPSEPS